LQPSIPSTHIKKQFSRSEIFDVRKKGYFLPKVAGRAFCTTPVHPATNKAYPDQVNFNKKLFIFIPTFNGFLCPLILISEHTFKKLQGL